MAAIIFLASEIFKINYTDSQTYSKTMPAESTHIWITHTASGNIDWQWFAAQKEYFWSYNIFISVPKKPGFPYALPAPQNCYRKVELKICQFNTIFLCRIHSDSQECLLLQLIVVCVAVWNCKTLTFAQTHTLFLDKKYSHIDTAACVLYAGIQYLLSCH